MLGGDSLFKSNFIAFLTFLAFTNCGPKALEMIQKKYKKEV